MASTLKTFNDERGELQFMFETPPFDIKQSIRSFNHKNVLRGLHCSPYEKIVVCNNGHIFDVIVKEDGSHYTFVLKKGDYVYVPKNCAHGYYCYEDSDITYFFGGIYDQKTEKNYHYNDPTLNIQWPCVSPIVSLKDQNNGLFKTIDTLILGSTGFIGTWIKKAFPNALVCTNRLDDIHAFINFIKPKHVVSAAGISGKPTISWCEDNKEETTHVNLICQLNLIKTCKDIGCHLTIVGSGAIYRNPGVYTETDIPDYHDMFYCHTRILLEDVIKSSYINDVLYLRTMYPISGDDNKKCFLNKLKQRLDSVHDVDICFTYLPDMVLNILPELVHSKKTGIVNFVNKGSIKLSTILNMLSIKHNTVKFDGSRPLGLLKSSFENSRTVEECVKDCIC